MPMVRDVQENLGEVLPDGGWSSLGQTQLAAARERQGAGGDSIHTQSHERCWSEDESTDQRIHSAGTFPKTSVLGT